MVKASREFQVFAKPIGPVCNLGCGYCYYLKKQGLNQKGDPVRMPEETLEAYIIQQIDAYPGPVIPFSWHGGEPTLLGLDYFRTIVELQRKHQPPDRTILNGIQTNGTLLDKDWCRFLAAERFAVGLSLDGPKEMHDRYRVTKGQEPTYEQVMRGYALLREGQVSCDILCVVHAGNVHHPSRVYQFFKQIGAGYIGFLPLVEREPEAGNGVSRRTAPAEAFGTFLCTVFDEWLAGDIGRVTVQIFEEAIATALGREPSLCVFRKTCGEVPVLERNGDFFSCDHFVDAEHRLGNIKKTPLIDLLDSPAQRAFGKMKLETLPRRCSECEVLAMCNGGCPKDRFLDGPEGEAGLNYLCPGYRRFFNHCRPFLAQLSALSPHPVPAAESSAKVKAGRNNPCPCGSGRKYKKCCGRGFH